MTSKTNIFAMVFCIKKK